MSAIAVALAALAGGYIAAREHVDQFVAEQLGGVRDIANKVDARPGSRPGWASY